MATALNLALGNDPTEVVYNQPDLRPHLVKCLESATISPFPSLKTRNPANNVTRVEECTIFCYCRMPDDHTEMIQCDNCDNWFHCHCVDDYKENLNWFCSNCEKRNVH